MNQLTSEDRIEESKTAEVRGQRSEVRAGEGQLAPTDVGGYGGYELLEISDAGLRESAVVKSVPKREDEDQRFLALCADIEENGIREPIPITRKREILTVDGAERYAAARRVQCPLIPVVYVPEDQALTAFLGGLVLKRNFTRSALAYLAYPMMEDACSESRRRRVNNLKIGKNPNVSPNVGNPTFGKTEDLARHYGFNRELFFMAKEVHRIFFEDEGYKAQMEPRILAEPIGGEHEDRRPVGLGAVIAGWGGREKTLDQARPETQMLLRFEKSLDGLKHWASYWEKFEGVDRAQAVRAIRETFSELPEGLRETMAVELRKLKN